MKILIMNYLHKLYYNYLMVNPFTKLFQNYRLRLGIHNIATAWFSFKVLLVLDDIIQRVLETQDSQIMHYNYSLKHINTLSWNVFCVLCY